MIKTPSNQNKNQTKHMKKIQTTIIALALSAIASSCGSAPDAPVVEKCAAECTKHECKLGSK